MGGGNRVDQLALKFPILLRREAQETCLITVGDNEKQRDEILVADRR